MEIIKTLLENGVSVDHQDEVVSLGHVLEVALIVLTLTILFDDVFLGPPDNSTIFTSTVPSMSLFATNKFRSL